MVYLKLLGFSAALAFISVILFSAVAHTMSVVSTSTSIGVVQNSVEADSSYKTRLNGESILGVSLSAAGTTCPGVEATSSDPEVRNALSLGNFVYEVVVTEAAADSWSEGTIYRGRVFGDGALLATLYFQNETAEEFLGSDVVEGVRIRVDSGSMTDDIESYTIMLESLGSC